MTQTAPTVHSNSQHAEKAVYFATGEPAVVASEFALLGLGSNGTQLRVVAPENLATMLPQMLRLDPKYLLTYKVYRAPLLWLQLAAFLGFTSRVEIRCVSSPRRFRFLKFLALSLRGSVIFSPGGGEKFPLGVSDLFNIWLGKIRLRWQLRKLARQRLPIGVVSSASPRSLERILTVLRSQYPGVPIHGLLPRNAAASTHALFNGVQWMQPGLWCALRAYGRLWWTRKRYQKWVVPFTNESYRTLKFLALLWPLRRRQIYNELGDGFALRDVAALWRHFRWRLSELVSLWSALRCRFSSEAREARDGHLPVGVLGSASGYYLTRIVAVLRVRYPDVPICGLLLSSVPPSTVALFDSVQLLPPRKFSLIGRGSYLWRVRKKYRCWIIPCTDEPFGWMKCMAFLWPLRRRKIYNEMADGFAVRNWRIFFLHLRWRLRDRMSFQILTGAAGRSFAARLAHLLCYSARILWAVPLLVWARGKGIWYAWTGRWTADGTAGRRQGVTSWNDTFDPRAKGLARRRTVAPRFPGEPDGSIELE